MISIIDTIRSKPSEGKSKEEKYGAQLLEANKFIGLIELLSKHYPPAIEYLKKAIAYEPREKKEAEAPFMARTIVRSFFRQSPDQRGGRPGDQTESDR